MPTFFIARSVHWRDAPNLRVKCNFAQIFSNFLFILYIDFFLKLCSGRARLCRARFPHPHLPYGFFCCLFDFHFPSLISRNQICSAHTATYATLVSLFLSRREPRSYAGSPHLFHLTSLLKYFKNKEKLKNCLNQQYS